MASQVALPACANCSKQLCDHGICISDCKTGPIYICCTCVPNPEALHINEALKIIRWARNLSKPVHEASAKQRGIV